MMFDEPVLLQAGWWYVAWARVSGPSSDCGSHGQASITTDDGYFFFPVFLNAEEEISYYLNDCFLCLFFLFQCCLSV